ncbi:ATP-binding protein [uncultured Fusobacterium sp.]|uniref:ATP-binding protein n=1 Tax=uncultured Fusobacterium sp. TaxID=159267 RepID=UPI002805543E|nr:ATP-binding protein [uncultured Fusobacterium sp.]
MPTCDCDEKRVKQEAEEREFQRLRECQMNRIKKYRDISVIDKKFIDSTFEKSKMEDKHMDICKRFADKFVEVGTAPAGLMMFGSVGTGKTHASSCVANFLMNHNKTVLVMNLGLYINKLQREWAEAEKDVLDYVRTCDLLVIDDFGVEKTSEYVKDKTFALIDARYRTGKPVIITTNLNIVDIKEKFGARISDRISEMCFQLAVVGESKRAKKAKNEFLEFIA